MATAVFLLLLVAAWIVSVYTNEKPVIEALSPVAAFPEENLTITGSGFGDQRGNGDVFIAGIRLTSSHYQSWTDNEIRIKVPYGVESGRVYVVTDKGRSNGVLFTNRIHIPVILSGPVEPGHPYVESVSPDKGTIGDRVLIEGLNFGRRRGGSTVSFRFLAVDTTSAGGGDTGIDQRRIICNELDFDYELWSDQEILVFVPDGAVSGSLWVETDRGRSNSVYFEVTNPVGTKRFEQKKGYQIQQDVRIRNLKSLEGEAGLEVWVPRLFEGYAQRNVEAVFDPEPLWENYHGVMRYSLKPEGENYPRNLSINYWFDRFSILTDINSNAVESSYDQDRKLYAYYTKPNLYIPSEDELISSTTASVVGKISNPYRKAEAIYTYLLRHLEYDRSWTAERLSDSLESRRAGMGVYGLLFTAMARSAGIPARPIAGFIVHGDKLTRRHVWAEFYLPRFGWVPVDPALGDGAGPYDLQVQEPATFYFGNLENQHIAFTRQVVDIPRVNPQSLISRERNPYALLTAYEEYPAALEGYRVDRQDIRVIDWW
jgi:transglutaminase-like putative cysteine protease